MSFPSALPLDALVLAEGLSLSSFLAPAAILVIVMILMRRGKRSRRRGGGDKIIGPFRDKPKGMPPQEVTQWTVEMHELVRDTKAEIDSKVALLRQTLLLAQEQEQRLAALIERLERLQADAPLETVAPVIDAAEPSEPADQREALVARLSRGGYSDVYIANQVGATLTEIRQLLERHESKRQ